MFDNGQYLTKKMKKNEGEVPQYYVKDSHAAIIDPLLFQRVQQERERRKRLGRGKSRGNSIFSGRVICGCCGGIYGRKVWNSTDQYRRIIWRCNEKYRKGHARCTTRHVTEEELKENFVAAFNQVMVNREQVLSDCQAMVAVLEDSTDLDAAIAAQFGIIAEARNLISTVDDGTALLERVSAAQEEISRLQAEKADRAARAGGVRRFMKNLEERDGILEEFDSALWLETVEKVVIETGGSLRVVWG